MTRTISARSVPALQRRVLLQQNVAIGLWIAVPIFICLLLIVSLLLARRARALPA